MAKYTIELKDTGDLYATCTLEVKDGSKFLVRTNNTVSVNVTLRGVSELALMENVVLELWTHSGNRKLAQSEPHTMGRFVESYTAVLTASAGAVASDDYSTAPRVVIRSDQTDSAYDYITALTLYKTRQAPIIEFEAERCTVDGDLDANARYVRVVGYKIVSGDGIALRISDLYSEGVYVNGDMVPFYVGMSETALTEGGYSETKPEWNTSTYAAALTISISIDIEWTLDGTSYTSSWSGNVIPSRVNLHLSGASTGGVAVGRFSTSTEGSPKFECAYPAYLQGGLGAPLGLKSQLVLTSNKSCSSGSNVDVLSYTATEAGLYLVIGNLRFDTNTSGRRNSAIKLTHESDEVYISNDSRTPVSGSSTRVCVMAVRSISAGDTLTLIAYQNSGSSIYVLGDANEDFTYMDVVRLC